MADEMDPHPPRRRVNRPAVAALALLLALAVTASAGPLRRAEKAKPDLGASPPGRPATGTQASGIAVLGSSGGSPTAPEASGPSPASPKPSATAPGIGASVPITQFTDAGWGNTTVDASGAVVIADPDVSPPTFLRFGTSPDQLPHRYGFYELEVSAPVQITHYSVRWTEETPPGSRIEMFTGSTDYRSGPGMSEPAITRGDTSADVSLAMPAEHVGVTFELYSGIGAASADPGPSPRLTSVTISSPDTDSLTVTPLAPPPNWANPDAGTIAVHGPPSNAPISPPGTLVQAPALPPFSPSLPPQDRPSDWSTDPTLGTASGETYHGRIVVELYQNSADDQTLFIPGTTTQPQFRQQALAALQGQTSPESTPAAWPAAPIIGNGASDTGPYLGRVVVELWDSTTNVAVTAVGASADDLVQRALQDLTPADIP